MVETRDHFKVNCHMEWNKNVWLSHNTRITFHWWRHCQLCLIKNVSLSHNTITKPSISNHQTRIQGLRCHCWIWCGFCASKWTTPLPSTQSTTLWYGHRCPVWTQVKVKHQHNTRVLGLIKESYPNVKTPSVLHKDFVPRWHLQEWLSISFNFLINVIVSWLVIVEKHHHYFSLCRLK